MTLEDLLRAVRDGEEGAFNRLVIATRKPLVAYFMKRGIPEAYAEDLMHEVLLTAHDKLPGMERSSLRKWFFRLTYYKSVDHHRAVARGRETSLSHVHLLMNLRPGAHTQIRSEQQRRKLHALLRQMPIALREVAQLDLDSGDPAAFAASKGITLEAVRHRRWRYREWLRRHFPVEFRNSAESR